MKIELQGSHYTQEVNYLCTLFKLKLRDGSKMGFTSFDEDILKIDESDNLIYKAFGGMTPSAVTSSNALNVDNLDVDGYLDDDSITESDLQSGKYDLAEVTIYEMNWLEDTSDYTNCNIKKTGVLGQVKIIDGKFIAEIRGITQLLQNNIGEVYQATCRTDFCDSKCKLNSATYTIAVKVLSVTDQRNIIIDTSILSGKYKNGLATFTSGLNIGLMAEIKENSSNTIEFQLPLNYLIQVDDELNIIKGCNKILDTCLNEFNNVINFRGEPFIPQIDVLINTHGANK